MLTLTDEQVEAAAKALWQHFNPSDWVVISNETQSKFRSAVRAAAPHLQAPWEMPTRAEVVSVYNTADHATRGTFGALLHDEVIKEFVRTRNAALQPKPVDPRREIVSSIINDFRGGNHTTSELAERILAVLDMGGAQ